MKKCELKNSITAITMPLIMLAVFFITSCNKNDSNNSGTASTTFKVTDAAIDDASVTGAFVTISDIKLDGQSVQGFTKTTVDLNAYQNGTTQTIGTYDLSSKTYSNITFVLDYDMDASGNSPGSYVVTTGAVKHQLQSDAGSITVTKNISTQANTNNSIVADFDLRKMVIHQAGADHYDFATSAELANSIRVVSENSTGTISGTFTDNVLGGSGRVVAYAYKKGTFDRTTEMQGQGSSNIQFKNAVSSAVVSGGSYQFHFLESGDYEIHFASYKDTDSDGEFELQGTLVVVATGGIDLLNLTLNTNTTLTVDATATAILP